MIIVLYEKVSLHMRKGKTAGVIEAQRCGGVSCADQKHALIPVLFQHEGHHAFSDALPASPLSYGKIFEFKYAVAFPGDDGYGLRIIRIVE